MANWLAMMVFAVWMAFNVERPWLVVNRMNAIFKPEILSVAGRRYRGWIFICLAIAAVQALLGGVYAGIQAAHQRCPDVAAACTRQVN